MCVRAHTHTQTHTQTIIFSQPLQVTVTLLPAGHCPGSVMWAIHWSCDLSDDIITGWWHLFCSLYRRLQTTGRGHQTHSSTPSQWQVIFQPVLFRRTVGFSHLSIRKWLQLAGVIVRVKANKSVTCNSDVQSFSSTRCKSCCVVRYSVVVCIRHLLRLAVIKVLSLRGRNIRNQTCVYQTESDSPLLPCLKSFFFVQWWMAVCFR